MNGVFDRTLVTGALLALAGCEGRSMGPSGGLVDGEWNGAHLSTTLDREGGTTEYDCAHGTIAAPVVLDGENRFRVPGVHVREHGGPVRSDEVVDSVPATYWGGFDNEVLTMRVAIGTDTLGPFFLRRDAPYQLLKCL